MMERSNPAIKNIEFRDLIEKVRDQTDIIQVIIHRTTFSRMKELTDKNFPIAWTLYSFYYAKARRDKTKKLLLQHGFIEMIEQCLKSNGGYSQKTIVRKNRTSNEGIDHPRYKDERVTECVT